jgi:hypothetical protein
MPQPKWQCMRRLFCHCVLNLTAMVLPTALLLSPILVSTARQAMGDRGYIETLAPIMMPYFFWILPPIPAYVASIALFVVLLSWATSVSLKLKDGWWLIPIILGAISALQALPVWLLVFAFKGTR